jgi:hypothetical protein
LRRLEWGPKIAQFYGDPAQRHFDAKAIRYSRHRRALCTRTTLGWKVYRMQHYYRRRAQGMVSGAIQREVPRLVSALITLLRVRLGRGIDWRLRRSAWTGSNKRRASPDRLGPEVVQGGPVSGHAAE